MVRFSVCVLMYGDHLDLAMRCLESLVLRDDYKAHVQEFRLGLNRVGRDTYDYAIRWGDSVASAGTDVIYYLPEWPPGVPAYKYPLMRAMLRDAQDLADNVMWFDDDSFLSGDVPNWWDLIAREATLHMCVGQLWHQPVQGNQKAFFATQPWYRRELGTPEKLMFLQGGWWTVRSHILIANNWPVPELRHNGGDSMFGELCRHQGLPLYHFDRGVRINADSAGRHSASRRRGFSEGLIGHDYVGSPLPTNHHNFDLRRWVRRCTSPTT